MRGLGPGELLGETGMEQDIAYDSADGLRLYARRYGRRDAPLSVLCLHGLTRNHRDFAPLIAHLEADHDIIAVDQRGRGRSAWDPNPQNYSPLTYVGDMARLLDTLGLERVAIIGTSMGGLMAMIMMKTMPQRVRGVVMNDIGPRLEKAGLDRIGGYVGKTATASSWQEASEMTARVQASAFPDYTAAQWMDFARRTWIEKAQGEIVPDYDPAIATSLSKIKPDWKARVAAWRLFEAMKAVPLLIVRGERSDLFSAATARLMMRRHGRASEVVVPRVGHAPILDEPMVVPAVRSFLAGLS
jgi:pimeloyl-ACP methyl ester carboxylesterase